MSHPAADLEAPSRAGHGPSGLGASAPPCSDCVTEYLSCSVTVTLSLEGNGTAHVAMSWPCSGSGRTGRRPKSCPRYRHQARDRSRCPIRGPGGAGDRGRYRARPCLHIPVVPAGSGTSRRVHAEFGVPFGRQLSADRQRGRAIGLVGTAAERRDCRDCFARTKRSNPRPAVRRNRQRSPGGARSGGAFQVFQLRYLLRVDAQWICPMGGVWETLRQAVRSG